MATISHREVLAPTDVWHRRYSSPLVLALLVLPFAVAIAWALAQPRPDERAVAAHLRATATVVDEHARSMTRLGERMAEAAGRSTATDRDTWIAYGRHMSSDGRALEELAARLRAVAPLTSTDQLPGGTAAIAAPVLEARWDHLRADGLATAEHGRVMVQMAADLAAGVRAGILTERDVDEIRSAAAGMVVAGQQIARNADLLHAASDQMGRWMGVGR